MMDCAPIITDFIPLAHTLLMVVHGTVLGRPAKSAACLAGACPTSADTTLPMYTSPMSSGARPARATTSLMATAPRSGAFIDDSAPLNEPIGVRAADTITTSSMDATTRVVDSIRPARAACKHRWESMIRWAKVCKDV